MTGVTDVDVDALFEAAPPEDHPASTNPAKSQDTLRFVAFNPSGLAVRGTHNPETLLVLPQLQGDFSRRLQEWRSRILARPGGFDGHRAVLLSFRVDGNKLQIHTGYRTYTEGRALHDALAAARAAEEQILAPRDLLRPHAGLAWGTSLATYVLLPHEHILCSRRAGTLAVDPGVWTCRMTEVLEPSDVDWRSMDKLLARLIAEELPSLAGLGHSKFVGLGVMPLSYTWQLVGVLDLRTVPFEQVAAAIAALQSDAETSAWSVHPLQPLADDERPYPAGLYRPEASGSAHHETAEFLSRSITPC